LGVRGLPNPTATSGESGRAMTKNAVVWLLAFACAAALVVHGYSLLRPILILDDFQLLAQSWTWPIAWNNLWLPTNEHAMPLGRLSIWALVEPAARPTLLPYVTAPQGPLAVMAGMLLVYLFVRRERGHSFYGLLAMVLFGVTAIYQQAVYWFSASFSILTLDTLLLALLAAQRWRQTGRVRHLTLCALWSALAPGWFASGILAGPLCCLYLLPPAEPEAADEDKEEFSEISWRHLAVALVPLLGSIAFLAVSLPRTANHIMHLEHYEGKTAIEAFSPLTGLGYTGRSLVDNLTLGQFGITRAVCPVVVVPSVLVVLAALAGWWLWRAPRRRLPLLGLGMILSSYWLVYSARGTWSYDDANMAYPAWSRYHLLPQLGLALFVVGGLPRWEMMSPELSKRQVWIVAGLIVLEMLIQLPRGVLGTYAYENNNGKQLAVLRQIEEMDARCREHHIAADAARAVLPRLDVPMCYDRVNGWDFLRGSPDPRPLEEAEVRRLLDVTKDP
jgi:hypothetical protein